MNKKQNINYTNIPIISKEKIEKEGDIDKKNSKLFTGFIVAFIIILLLFCGSAMAKIVDEIIVKTKAEIAEAILIVENNPTLDITAENNEGIYTFKIKNYNEQNKITETNLKYYIEILPKLDDSINLELYQENKKINLNNNRTEYIEISKDRKQEVEYKIKITYDKDKSNSIYDIMEKIQVKVHTEQVKA